MQITPYLMLISFFAIYTFGNSKKENERFYDEAGKGTVYGKFVFSILLAVTMFLPGAFLSGEEWIDSVLMIAGLLIAFEVIHGFWNSKQKDRVGGFFGIIILGLAYTNYNTSFTPFLLLQIVTICIVVDLFANIFGKLLVRMGVHPILRLKYPAIVSPNKSGLAAILAVLLVFCLNGFMPEGWGVNSSVCLIAAVSAVYGDAFFSVFKRMVGIKDFFPTLGPIGGLSDRADSWMFAISFVGHLL